MQEETGHGACWHRSRSSSLAFGGAFGHGTDAIAQSGGDRGLTTVAIAQSGQSGRDGGVHSESSDRGGGTLGRPRRSGGAGTVGTGAGRWSPWNQNRRTG